MSQFPSSPDYGAQLEEPIRQRRSGMALTALILSLTGIIPCCGTLLAVIGVILGLVGVFSIGKDPAVKGRGMAGAAVVIGLALILGWIAALTLLGQHMTREQHETPGEVMRAVNAVDYTAFRENTFGAAGAATDTEIQEFADVLTDRYGSFATATFDEQRFAQGVSLESMMQPLQTYPYTLQFANATVEAEFVMGMNDPNTGSFSWNYRIDEIRITDPDLGDLTFPPGPSSSPSGGNTPGTGDQPDATDSDAADEGDG